QKRFATGGRLEAPGYLFECSFRRPSNKESAMRPRSLIRLLAAVLSAAASLLPIFASSAVGQTSWQRSAANPVLPGPTAGGYAFSPSVIYDSAANIYQMWYTARATGGYGWSIYYAISLDGATWFSYINDPVLQAGPSYFENDGVVYCSVIRDGI